MRTPRCMATVVSAHAASHCPSRCRMGLLLPAVLPSGVFSACHCSLTTFPFFRLRFGNFRSRLFSFGGCQTLFSVGIQESHFRNSEFRLSATFASFAPSTAGRSMAMCISPMAVPPMPSPLATRMDASTPPSSCILSVLPLSLLPGCTFLIVATPPCVVLVALVDCNLAARAPAGGRFACLSKPILLAPLLFHFLLGTCSLFASSLAVTPATALAPSILTFVPPPLPLSKRALSPGRAAFLFS